MGVEGRDEDGLEDSNQDSAGGENNNSLNRDGKGD